MKTFNALLLVAVAFSIELCVTADPSAEKCDSEASTGEHCTAAGRYKGPDPISELDPSADPGPIQVFESLVNFKGLIECETGDRYLFGLDILGLGISRKYAHYGCYCGYGGSGTPVDELDRCCEVHDDCYGKVQKHPSCKGLFGKGNVPYLKDYDYTCDEETKTGTCSESNDECRMILCECDKVAANCFAKAPYNDEHKHYPQHLC